MDENARNDIEQNEAPDETAQGTSDRTVQITHGKYDRHIVVPDPSQPEVRCLNWDEIDEISPSQPGLVTDFVVEKVDVGKYGRYSALRAKGTEMYLTAVPYGDGPRNKIKHLLLDGIPVLPDIIDRILDYVVKPASPITWIEGPGFSYSPITVEPGPPNTLQLFRLTRRDHQCYRLWDDEVGIRTFHGTYLRAGGPVVGDIVSQSPLCQDEEKWELFSDSEDSDSEDEY